MGGVCGVGGVCSVGGVCGWSVVWVECGVVGGAGEYVMVMLSFVPLFGFMLSAS